MMLGVFSVLMAAHTNLIDKLRCQNNQTVPLDDCQNDKKDKDMQL